MSLSGVYFELFSNCSPDVVQGAGIEEDLEAYADDRGHSAHHPGYRRRQLRFLTLKIFSQVLPGPSPHC